MSFGILVVTFYLPLLFKMTRVNSRLWELKGSSYKMIFFVVKTDSAWNEGMNEGNTFFRNNLN